MKRILIIDDSHFALKMLKKILTEAGYSVLEADNGLIGLDLAIKEKPDLILTDLLMPEMDGLEMIKNLRGKNISIPVIVLTANIQDTVHKECLEMGVAGFVQKLPKHEELLNVIRQVFNPRENAS